MFGPAGTKIRASTEAEGLGVGKLPYHIQSYGGLGVGKSEEK